MEPLSKPKKLMPTGVCWCGCGTELGVGSFFSPGHDKIAEAKIIREVFGDVAHFVAAFGKAPGDARPIEEVLVTIANRARLVQALRQLDELREVISGALVEAQVGGTDAKGA